MKFIFKVLALYLLSSFPLYAEIEPMVNVCNEKSFLKCSNKSKKQCENAFSLSKSYCETKLELDKKLDWNNYENIRELMRTYGACMNTSVVAYFDGEAEKFYACLSKTDYKKRLNKFSQELTKKRRREQEFE